MMTIKWSGNPQSGAIAVTILEMDGTQVNVDSIDVEEKAGAVSVKDAAMSAIKDMLAENGSSESPKSEEIKLIVEQEPAKKEESMTGDVVSSQDEPEMPNGKPEESDEKLEGENVAELPAEQEAVFVNEPDCPEEEAEKYDLTS